MFLHEEHCHVCEKVTQHANHECCLCEEKKAQKKEAQWDALSMAAQIKQLKSRIEALERGNRLC